MLIINLAKLTVHYNNYEHVWDSQVYSLQVYSKLLLLTSLQVYCLQQIVATYKSRPISELLHFCTVDS